VRWDKEMIGKVLRALYGKPEESVPPSLSDVLRRVK
jgi:hypothetical protein